jgi:putative nucleotidyltransferase with HDIG domain
MGKVQVKKKVEVDDLKPGMFVYELDRPWLETPFMFQGFEITSAEQIEALHQYCKFVYIDTSLGQDVAEATPPPPRRAKVESLDKRRIELEVLRSQARSVLRKDPYVDSTTLEEEIHQVSDTYRYAQDLMDKVLDDVRESRDLDIDAISQLSADFTASIIRNPDALALFSLVRQKSDYIAHHSLRVCILALGLGRQIGLEQESLNVLGIGALLHDVGKIRVPTELLEKRSDLSPAEAEIIKRHVGDGLRILRQYAPGMPTMALEVVGWHHERYDGSGYPLGAKGNDISQFGHIGAIVDYYEGVTGDRPWRQGADAHSTLMHMYDRRGQLFEPELVEQFIRYMGVYPIGSVVQLNTGERAVVITRNRERHLRPRVVLASDAENRVYSGGRIIDLSRQRTEGGQLYEIVRVLSPEEHNLDPQAFFPLVA